MDRNTQKIGLINWVALLITTVGSGLLASYLNFSAGWIGTAVAGVGFLIAIISWFQMRLEEREGQEQMEFDELNRAKNSASLFSTDEADNFPARRSREQFERFFIPIFSILLVAGQAGAIWWIWTQLKTDGAVMAGRATVAMALYAMFGLMLFLLGKYSSSVARLGKERLLRPGGAYLLLTAYLFFALTATVAALEAGFPRADDLVTQVLCVILALIGVESVIGLILEGYRPRVRGRVGRLLYDSRLVGLLGQPESLFSTAAQALDYQFGFKVSDTWMYRFMERSLGWLLLGQVTVLLLSTSVVFIETGEQGLLERFGRPVGGGTVLNPGLHVKMPWPIDQVARYKTRQLQSFNIGFVPDSDHNEGPVLWTVNHYKEEFNMLVASREQFRGTASSSSTTRTNTESVAVNLLTVSIPVQFQVKDVKAWAYNYSDAAALLERIAAREVVRFMVGADLHELMSTGRWKAAQTLRERIQAEADGLKLGVDIMFVGLQDIHPPVKVAADYEQVIAAEQQVQAEILRAQAFKAETLPRATSEALAKTREAEAYEMSRVSSAGARAAQFTNQLAAYRAAPTVYPQRAYLEKMAQAIQKTKKTVIGATNANEVIQLNLEEKVRTDLQDITVRDPKEKQK